MVEAGQAVKREPARCGSGGTGATPAVKEALSAPSHSRRHRQRVVARQAPYGGFMRCVFAALAAVLVLAGIVAGASSARAERRLFIIANNSDGYGVDRCLTSGASCGETVANSYCHPREFAQALSFRKVERDDITGAIPASATDPCSGGSCDAFVAIECSR
jgi:hypothetical protein